MEAANEVLDLGALTIGFARRFATYKRGALLLRDPDRLARISRGVAALRGVFARVTPYLTSSPLYGGLWMMACCSDTLDPHALSAGEIDARIASRGIGDLQYYNGDMHRAALALPNFVRALVG